METFKKGDRVVFIEPQARDIRTQGVVIYTLPSGLVGVRPEGCRVSRVLCAPADVLRTGEAPNDPQP